MTPAEVIAAWTELTSQSWRLVPYQVTSEAAEFAAAGFTREEMQLVVAYTRRMISREEGGFNAQSLTWRVMAADRWQKFQERLDAAKQTKLARQILFGGGGDGSKAAKPPTPDEPRIDRTEGAAKLRAWREQQHPR